MHDAIAQLTSLGAVVAQSRFMATEPVGEGLHGMFLNAVVCVDTDLAPNELLRNLLQIETGMGRDRALGRDRVIDLDILLMFDNATHQWVRSQMPALPHPRMWQRSFVTDGLSEVLPDWLQVRKVLDS